MRRNQALAIANLTRHQFYHRPKSSRGRGRPRSQDCIKVGTSVERKVSNQHVVSEMVRIDGHPDLSCGKKRMTCQLQLLGYKINIKKVERLMKENGLTKPKRRMANKSYARYRIVTPKEPLTVIEMDIKQVWITRERRSAYILTVIDTFTREVLAWTVGMSITHKEVTLLWNQVINNHLEPAKMASRRVVIEVRNDGGPQFASKAVQHYFKENGLNQVFTHPYTPQENGHIESFHNILSNSIEKEFFDLIELENRLHMFYLMYNTKRCHTSTKGLPPSIFRKAWEKDLVEVSVDAKKRVKFKLTNPLYEIPGILSQGEHLAKKTGAKRTELKQDGKTNFPVINHLTPVYPSPLVASCLTN